jgi:hypothetical protein
LDPVSWFAVYATRLTCPGILVSWDVKPLKESHDNDHES